MSEAFKESDALSPPENSAKATTVTRISPACRSLDNPESDQIPVPLGKVVGGPERTLTQLYRSGQFALYEARNDRGVLTSFEVIKIRVKPAQTLFGRDYPAREVYPSSAKNNRDWGSQAWTLPSWGRHLADQFLGRLKSGEQPRAILSSLSRNKSDNFSAKEAARSQFC
jgi:hypothetical protein